MSESRVRENRMHGSMRRREATPASRQARAAPASLPPTLRRDRLARRSRDASFAMAKRQPAEPGLGRVLVVQLESLAPVD
jgi:hypothetical protein